MDWRLAQGAVWPVTAERLAEAVYGTRSAAALGQIRRLVRLWEAQGRIVCFARGSYDRVRPDIVLDPSVFGRSVLPKAEIQTLKDHHPEVQHWPSRALAAAWRGYSRLYGAPRLPVLARREPTLLEYLLVRQLNPDSEVLGLDAQYETWCQDAALYRLIPAPSEDRPLVTVENIESGRIDFQALAKATREGLQLRFEQRGAGRVAQVKGST
ncbi:hypothetical protein ACFSC4_20020 [Deinococcus malanensis]|uniref:hypothetical protein n=1 Tax=Deinococcus malanensis TaxID=1706855 RepID=UPI00362D3FBE